MNWSFMIVVLFPAAHLHLYRCQSVDRATILRNRIYVGLT